MSSADESIVGESHPLTSLEGVTSTTLVPVRHGGAMVLQNHIMNFENTDSQRLPPPISLYKPTWN